MISTQVDDAPVPRAQPFSSPDVDSISLLIRTKDSYFDTVVIYVNPPPTEQQKRELQSMAKSVTVRGPMFKHEYIWPTRLQLQQPTQKAFEYITDRFESLITRVDVSLDLVTASRSHARTVHAFLDRHRVQRWPGAAQPTTFESTTYSGKVKVNGKLARNVCAIYADKRYRRIPEPDFTPCCHIDWRVMNASAVKAAGIQSLSDLVNFDFREFWQHRLALRQLPSTRSELRKLGRAILHQSKRKRPFVKSYRMCGTLDWDLNVGARFMRASVTGFAFGVSGGVRVHDARKFLSERLDPASLDRHFPKMPVDWLLPGQDPSNNMIN